MCKDLFAEANDAAARLAGEASSAGASSRPASGRMTWAVLAAALGLGIAADLLLRSDWGINFSLWMALVALAVVGVARHAGYVFRRAQLGMLAGMLLLGAALAWRYAGGLAALNLLAIVTLAAWLALPARVPSLRDLPIGAYLKAAAGTATNVCIGFVPLLTSDIPSESLRSRSARAHALRVARGVLFAAPLVLLFGLLFAAADARFQSLAQQLLRFDLETALTHAFVLLFSTWTTGGLLREVFLQSGALPVAFPRIRPRLSLLEIGIPLAALDVLFLVFVVVQVPYFFGGASFVEITPGLTYADYARRGFFELVIAAAFVLPLLLAGERLLSQEPAAGRRRFRALAATLVVLVLLVLASAWHRMHLYRAQFGWTEQRLYTTVFMVWLGLVFLWFAATVLRNRRGRFPFGALAGGFGVVAFLNLLNPAGFIVRANAERTDAEHPFDVAYAASLGPDAVPALLEVFPSVGEEERCLLAEKLRGMASWIEDPDWRAWNWSRARAARRLAENRALLEGTTCPEPD